MNPVVLFIVGPTAAGKSQLAMELARRLRGEIISADSMQIYRGMDIGTAKPSKSDQKKIPHHLINRINPSQVYSVFHFRKQALAAIRKIIRRKKIPIVVGGSGLYVRGLLQGFSAHPGPDHGLREKLEKEVQQHGVEALHERLRSLDEKRASQIEPRDKKRIIRALEIIEQSGKNPSEWHRSRELSLQALGFEPKIVGVMKDRAELYVDIEMRVEQMFRKGWAKEVQMLFKKRVSKTAAQALGYKEIHEALKEKKSLAETEVLLKKNTRHLAKRQLTWFKKEAGIEWFFWRRGVAAKTIAKDVIARFGFA